LPPERITPTRLPAAGIARSSSAANATAADGSMTSLVRSQKKRIAARIAASSTVAMRTA